MNQNKLATVLAAIVLGAGAANAQIVNADFDAGLAGWSTTGDVAIRDGAAYLTTAISELPGDDGASSFNFSGNNVVDTFGLSDFAGVAPEALDPDPANGNFAFEGSALLQTFEVKAGDVIGFSWQLFTNEVTGNDYAFVVLNGVVTVLGTSASAVELPGMYGFAQQNAMGTYMSAPFASAQTVTLAVGVVDAGSDGAVSTALKVDAVTVPEPSTAACLVLAGALGALRRRRAA